MRAAHVLRLPMKHPADLADLGPALDREGLKVSELVGLWIKTSGNGLANDFTRPWVEEACGTWLGDRLGVSPRRALAAVQVIVSGGCEGIVSPHLLAIASREQTATHMSSQKRLVAGFAQATPLPGQCATVDHLQVTASLVQQAITQAGLEDLEDVHAVMMRLPCASQVSGDAARTRAAGALGIAVALGETSMEVARTELEREGLSVHSSRAFVVARPDDDRQQVVVLGNVPGADSPFAAAHVALADPLDTPAVVRMLDGLGLSARPQLNPEDSARLTAVLIKADPPPSGTVRGLRHVMNSDADVAAHRHARAAFAATVAGVIGHPACFVGAGAECQGPSEGGLVIAIARM